MKNAIREMLLETMLVVLGNLAFVIIIFAVVTAYRCATTQPTDFSKMAVGQNDVCYHCDRIHPRPDDPRTVAVWCGRNDPPDVQAEFLKAFDEHREVAKWARDKSMALNK